MHTYMQTPQRVLLHTCGMPSAISFRINEQKRTREYNKRHKPQKRLIVPRVRNIYYSNLRFPSTYCTISHNLGVLLRSFFSLLSSNGALRVFSDFYIYASILL
jgi:hypothetical protein